MTDIDFDELDKAVNSALGPRAVKVPEASAVIAASEAKTEKTAEEPKSTDSPRIEVKSRQTIISPAAKRSGRFMDMVHPSSDMAQEKEKAAAPAPRVKIEPTENAPKPQDDAVKPEELAKVEDSAPEAIEPVETATPDEPSQTHDIVYPDPLDVAQIETPKEDEDDEVSTSKIEVPVVPGPVVAGETPFLPDAKVEKRPLGGPAPELATVDESAPDLATQESDEQLPPEADLPPALQSEVVAVESDDLPEEEETDVSDKEAEPAEPKKEAAKPVEAKPEKVEPKEVKKPEASTSGLNSSIPQQYHSVAEAADETPRPVFDTDQYHQPLIAAHSGKKSGPWLFIFLILALLLVGAGLGYFAYVSGF